MEIDSNETSGVMGSETVYGTHDDPNVVMSEKVQSLAGSIYQEFERMIARYDEDVVKTLMPLLVNVLECLDSAYQINQEQEVELELLREDNEQLVTQYEREKCARKSSEQKLLEMEDAAEGERKELTSRLESLESISRMLELKHKNSLEHSSRLEERESELKKEYAKLHERYTELFKTHMDYMERTKLLLSAGQLNDRSEVGSLSNSGGHKLQIGRSSGPVSFGFASLEGGEIVDDSAATSPISSVASSPRDHETISDEVRKTIERGQETDQISIEHRGTAITPTSVPPSFSNTPNSNLLGRSQTKREQRSANTLYQELSFDTEALGDMDEGADITGSWVHPGEYASSGMGKEVENLIMENNELLATKNALNIVKDDLIAKVDELTGEQEMLREEILALKQSRERFKERTAELEEEIKKLREANDTLNAKLSSNAETDDENSVPLAQRKRFTRVEMARVLMERNQFKERLMDLQDAVHWSELMRANVNSHRNDKKTNRGMWNMFSRLFSSTTQPEPPINSAQLYYNAPSNRITAMRALANNDATDADIGSKHSAARRAAEQRDYFRQVRANVKKDDGRVQAYGWSLPSKTSAGAQSTAITSSSGSNGSSSGSGKGGSTVPVPVPVYCRPLVEHRSDMKIWCAAGVNLMGGYTKDGGLMVGGSIFYYDSPDTKKDTEDTEITEVTEQVEELNRDIQNARVAALLETRLSSIVWICTSKETVSTVTVLDANDPANILETFDVCNSHLLCMTSVPGACASDYEDKTTTDDIMLNIERLNTDDDATKKTQHDVKVIRDVKVIKNVKFNEESMVKRSKSDGEILSMKSDVVESLGETLDKSVSEAISVENLSVYDKDDSESMERNGEDYCEQMNGEKSMDVECESVNTNMSTVLATMWLGSEKGGLYIHSSVANSRQHIHALQLHDAITAIVHVGNRVAVALADGSVAVFRRDVNTGQWDVSQYILIRLGQPMHAIRCLTVVSDNVWCGYLNSIFVLNPQTMQVVHTLQAHPRKESQVCQMVWYGEGVWVSIKLDSNLRLYHAYTYQHLQDVDIEPYVSKMLGTGKIGFSFVRITSLLVSSNRLWIGTCNGVIISVPLSESSSASSAGTIALRGAGNISNTTGTTRFVQPSPGNFIPYCSMAHAQLSFHGHRNNVKFFVAVPGKGGMSAATSPVDDTAIINASESRCSSPSKPPPAMLIMSGGEGYIDFRTGDNEMEDSLIIEEVDINATVKNTFGPVKYMGVEHEMKHEKNHLIVWRVEPYNRQF